MSTTGRHWLIQDFRASIVVFLVAIPLSMGMAIAADVPEDIAAPVGILTAIIGGIVVGLLAGCPLQVSGPEAGLAMFISQLIAQFGWEQLGLVILIAGVIQLLAGLLRLGQWFRAVPPSVIEGMLAGMVVLIFASQFHIMVDDDPPGKGKALGGIINLVTIPEAVHKGLSVPEHRSAALVGLATILTIMLWTTLAPKRIQFIPGPLVGVIVGASLAAALTAATNDSAQSVKFVIMPDNILKAAGRITLDFDWSQKGPELLLGGLALAFVASSYSLLTASAVDTMQQHAPRTNYDRELIAHGVGNSIAGIFQLLPVTGAIARTATNIQYGAQTRLSTILHGVWLIIFCALFPQVIRLIPRASLAAILVFTAVRIFKWRNFAIYWKLGKDEFLVYVATFGAVVFVDVFTGIITGVVLALLRLIYRFSHLAIRLELQPDKRQANLYLSGAATFIRLPKLADALRQVPDDYELHVHLEELTYIDHACLDLLTNWEKQHTKRGGTLVLDWETLTAKFRQVSQNSQKNQQTATEAGDARG